MGGPVLVLITLKGWVDVAGGLEGWYGSTPGVYGLEGRRAVTPYWWPILAPSCPHLNTGAHCGVVGCDKQQWCLE